MQKFPQQPKRQKNSHIRLVLQTKHRRHARSPINTDHKPAPKRRSKNHSLRPSSHPKSQTPFQKQNQIRFIPYRMPKRSRLLHPHNRMGKKSKKLKLEDFIKNMRQPLLIDGRRIYNPKEFSKKLKFAAIGLGGSV